LKAFLVGIARDEPVEETEQALRDAMVNLEAASGHQAAPRRKRQNEERLRTPEWTDNGLVFPNRVGRPMDHNNLYHREYKAPLKKAGLAEQGFTFHSLRHTFGTALFKRGEHPKIVQSLAWAREHGADDGYLLASAGGHRQRCHRRARRGLRIARLQ
jgi:integrase